MDNQQIQQTPGTNLDPTALALSRAIRSAENTNYNQVVNEPNGSTSFGAYGWNKNNFQDWAKQYGLDPNDTSETNQDHLAYERIKSLLDEGHSQSEIAAIWNGAKVENGKYVALNPSYVDKVKSEYEKQIGGSSTDSNGYVTNIQMPQATDNVQPTTQTQNDSLGQELLNRGQQLSTALSSTATGKINPLSGLIQVGGAAAGGLGDIVNKGLELIPGVKQVENIIGEGVGDLAKTQTGQDVIKAIQDFSSAHPELSGDIGAGFNIVTAIPILKGLGVVKNIAMDSVATTLKNAVEKGVSNDLTGILSRTVAGREAMADIPEGVKTLIDKRIMPDLVTEEGTTRYSSANAMKQLDSEISNIDNNELTPLLKSITPEEMKSLPVSTKFLVDNNGSDIAIKELHDPNSVQKILDRVTVKYGENPTLSQLNESKRTLSKQISETSFDNPNMTNLKTARKAIQKTIEDVASQLGKGDVNAINQRMGNLIKSEDLLSAINGKVINKKGLMHQLIKGASVVGGAGAGSLFGGTGSIAGALIGGGSSDYIESKLKGLLPEALRLNLLKRTGVNAIRTTLPEAVKGIGGLAGTTIAKKSIQK
jgi:hypothetical protein